MLSKQAVDAATKSYWEKFYGSYGKTLTRDIPKRIKAAVAKAAGLNGADGLLVPTATVMRDNKIVMEGTYRVADEGATMFTITISPEGITGEPSVMPLPMGDHHEEMEEHEEHEREEAEEHGGGSGLVSDHE